MQLIDLTGLGPLWKLSAVYPLSNDVDITSEEIFDSIFNAYENGDGYLIKVDLRLKDTETAVNMVQPGFIQYIPNTGNDFRIKGKTEEGDIIISGPIFRVTILDFDSRNFAPSSTYYTLYIHK